LFILFKAFIFESQIIGMKYLILIYILLALGVAFIGRYRKTGFTLPFIVSLLLTPIVGLLVVAHSNKKITYHEFQYHCPRCGYNFTEELEFCPYCSKAGREVRLVKEQITMT
jgi:DNA-directed RNA polymerase subunit RPC12/RpoP